jgi:hypothetical protein
VNLFNVPASDGDMRNLLCETRKSTNIETQYLARLMEIQGEGKLPKLNTDKLSMIQVPGPGPIEIISHTILGFLNHKSCLPIRMA